MSDLSSYQQNGFVVLPKFFPESAVNSVEISR